MITNNKLADLYKQQEELEKQIRAEEERAAQPKIYHPDLDKFCTAEEIIELENFFNKNFQTISTNLTSLVHAYDDRIYEKSRSNKVRKANKPQFSR